MKQLVVRFVYTFAAFCVFCFYSQAQVCDPCDFDGNGTVGVEDFYLLDAAIKSGENDLKFNVYDENDGQATVDFLDRYPFVDQHLQTAIGDSNWDGVFNTTDLVQVFQDGHYQAIPGVPDPQKTWAGGDWNGDLKLDSSDLVFAFNVGGFEQAPRRNDPIPDLPDPRQPSTTGALRLVPGAGPETNRAVTIVYNRTSGHLSVNSSPETRFTTLELRSTNDIFVRQSSESDEPCIYQFQMPDERGRCRVGVGPFDFKRPDRLFVLFAVGMFDVGFGEIMQPGLTADELMNELLLVNGSISPTGDLMANGGGGPYLWVTTGDFDNDGVLTATDIDLLSQAVTDNEPNTLFDVNDDWVVDAGDRRTWVEAFAKTFFGDSNFDGEFNSSDLVHVFQAGQYEDQERKNSGWRSGDWNGDHEFDSSDLVLVFQDGHYEQGLRGVVQHVPEPSTTFAFGMGVVGLLCLWGRQR